MNLVIQFFSNSSSLSLKILSKYSLAFKESMVASPLAIEEGLSLLINSGVFISCLNEKFARIADED